MNNKILTLGEIRGHILQYFPDLLWWDGYGKHQTFSPKKNYKHRQGMPNEIRIEFDYSDYGKNWEAINYTAIELNTLGYTFHIFYVDGGRGPHIHIYNLDELETLSYEQRKTYRQLFLNKVCKNFAPDIHLCDEKHLCALEFVNHFKYNNPKNLVYSFWNSNNMGIDFDIKISVLFNKKSQAINPKRKTKFGDLLLGEKRDVIINACEFEKVLDKYNINYKGHMALCPFHNDTNYSLSFSNDKGLWKCFGCEARGDIITLIKMVMEVKDGNKIRS